MKFKGKGKGKLGAWVTAPSKTRTAPLLLDARIAAGRDGAPPHVARSGWSVGLGKEYT